MSDQDNSLKQKKENKILKKQLKQLKDDFKKRLTLKEELEAVITNFPIVIWKTDQNANFTLSEGAGLKELGLRSGEVIGSSVFDFYADFPEIIAAHKRALNGEKVNFSIKIGVKNSNEKDNLYYSAVIKPCYDENQIIIGAIGIAQNITTMKEAEFKISETEMKYQTLFDSSPLGILVLQKGIVSLANPAFLNLFGYESEADIINMNGADFLAPEVRKNVAERNLRREDGKDEIPSYETVGLKKTGGKFPIQVEAKRIIFNGIPSVLAYIRDISDLTEIRKEKEQLQSQLLFSQKLESLGILAGGIAHDFNNLLAGILGNASLLKSRLSEDNEANQFHIEEVIKLTNEAATITKQMLAYSGKSYYNKVNFSFNHIIREINQLIELSVDKSISINYNLSGSDDNVIGDVSQLKQVVLNLIINASESIGNNSGNISIKTGSKKIDNTSKKNILPLFDLESIQDIYSYVEISDNGTGIAQEKINLIFDPFYSTKFTGRGLGLAVALGIIKTHKGFIEVKSKLNKGTTITILLPVSSELVSSARSPNIEKHHPNNASRTILFCDDDESLTLIAEKIINSLGIKVITAKNGLEALKIYKKLKGTISIIIMDLTMPVMTGREALVKIRGIDQKIPIILSSGYNEDQVMEEFQESTLISFLQKPYTPEVLKQTIYQYL